MTTYAMGWIDDPAEVARVSAIIRQTQGYLRFSEAAPHLAGTGTGKDVFFWELERKILGALFPSWNQGQIGSCVSHGWGRSAQDTLLVQIGRQGSTEGWEGHQVAREPIYGGSRIEIGHSPGGEGSVGAWAAQWVSKYGLLLYKKYDSTDLSGGYDVSRCRQWGDRGVPADLEAESRKHPVKGVVVVNNSQEAIDLLAAYKPIAICGSKGRTMQRRPGGWCPVEGTWAHCQALRGTCQAQGGANSFLGGDGAFPWAGNVQAIVYQNSWGDYLKDTNNQVQLASGQTITLPEGCYLSHPEETDSEFRQQDSFALSDATGWDSPTFTWD